jgi:hypothetical protein
VILNEPIINPINKDEPIIKTTVNTILPTHESQQDIQQGVTGSTYQNRALNNQGFAQWNQHRETGGRPCRQ